MKKFEFNNIYENQDRVDEFLTSMLAVMLLGNFALNVMCEFGANTMASVNSFNKEMQTFLEPFKKKMKERKNNKDKNKSKKEKSESPSNNSIKQSDDELYDYGKNALAAFDWHVDKMPDGDDKNKLLADRKQYQKAINGELEDKELKQLIQTTQNNIKDHGGIEKLTDSCNDAIQKIPPAELKSKVESIEKETVVVKSEEISDPKTGKKINVKTYTGPRGGKYYFPNSAPHDPEHKIYLNEGYGLEFKSLSNCILESTK